MTKEDELMDLENIIIDKNKEKIIRYVFYSVILMSLIIVLFFLILIRYRKGENISGLIYGFSSIMIISFHLTSSLIKGN